MRAGGARLEYIGESAGVPLRPKWLILLMVKCAGDAVGIISHGHADNQTFLRLLCPTSGGQATKVVSFVLMLDYVL